MSIKRIVSNKSIMQTMLGALTVLAVYMTFGFSTIAYKNSLFEIAHLVGCVIVAFLYIYFDRISHDIGDGYSGDIDVFNRVMLYVSFLFLVGGAGEFITKGTPVYTVISKLIFCGIFAIIHIKNPNKEFNFSLLKTNWKLLIVIGLTAVLMYEPYMFSPRWDSVLYYGDFSHIDMYSISAMGFFGHIAQGVGVYINLFITMMFGNVHAGLYLANLSAAILGIISFWAVLKRVFGSEREMIRLILTAGYAFLPCVLGMTSYFSVDFFVVNWFLVLVYLYVSEKFFLFSVVGFFYSFTKEPALIIYGGLCIGILVSDFVKNKWNVLKHSRYYGMLMTPVIWGITAAINGIWNLPGSGVGVSESHAVGELGLLFVYNYNWLIWVLAIVLGIMTLAGAGENRTSHNTKLADVILPTVISIALFVGFNLIFVTARNPRYIDNVTVGAFFLFAVFILSIYERGHRKMCVTIASVIGVLMLVSSYTTIDPVSLKLFPNTEFGRGFRLITAESSGLGDSCVYNKQAQWVEGAYVQAVKEAVEDGYTIVLDAHDNTVYGLDAMNGQIVLKSGSRDYEGYYDVSDGKRRIYADEDTVSYSTIAVSGSDAIDDITKQGQKYLYLYIDSSDQTNEKHIEANYNDCVEKEYSYRGFNLHGILFEGMNQ